MTSEPLYMQELIATLKHNDECEKAMLDAAYIEGYTHPETAFDQAFPDTDNLDAPIHRGMNRVLEKARWRSSESLAVPAGFIGHTALLVRHAHSVGRAQRHLLDEFSKTHPGKRLSLFAGFIKLKGEGSEATAATLAYRLNQITTAIGDAGDAGEQLLRDQLGHQASFSLHPSLADQWGVTAVVGTMSMAHTYRSQQVPKERWLAEIAVKAGSKARHPRIQKRLEHLARCRQASIPLSASA